MNENLLEVNSLNKIFKVKSKRGENLKVHAVNDVSFDVTKNQTVALVGESGCGKSTTGLSVLRLIEPTSGSIKFNGLELTNLKSKDLRKARSQFQMVFQNPRSQLDPRMRIEESIAEPLKAFNFGTKVDIQSRVKEVLELVGLDQSFGSRYPHQVSGGQRQRVGIARAIGSNPELIVLDEAIASLDVSVQTQIMNLLLDFQEKLGISYLFISHSMSSVRYLADRVVVMYLGRVVESALADDFFNKPHHPYSRALLSAVPVPSVKAKYKPELIKGDVPSPFNVPTGCVFRTRCSKAQDICSKVVPENQSIGKKAFVACHFPLD
jgi:oligopeptide/dipeptide ABC transporter ATP-binding protein